MNHLQMLIIFSSFEINWPSQVSKIFGIAAPIKLVTEAVVSFDCFMDSNYAFTMKEWSDWFKHKYNYLNFEYENHFIPIIYVKLCILAVLPVILILFSYISWSIILRITKKREEHYPKFIATMVFLLFLVHPSLT